MKEGSRITQRKCNASALNMHVYEVSARAQVLFGFFSPDILVGFLFFFCFFFGGGCWLETRRGQDLKSGG